MSILRDVWKSNEGFALRYKMVRLFSPQDWVRTRRWRKQRLERGWSDRDCWAAGEHIAKITAEMLQELNDNTYVDWPEWFRYNVGPEEYYNDLQQVVNDINAYLDYTESSWADDMDGDSTVDENGRLRFVWYEDGRELDRQEVKDRINAWHGENERLYMNATRAMQFFGRHFSSFWD